MAVKNRKKLMLSIGNPGVPGGPGGPGGGGISKNALIKVIIGVRGLGDSLFLFKYYFFRYFSLFCVNFYDVNFICF